MRQADHAFRDRSDEHSFQTGAAVRRENDQLSMFPSRQVRDFVSGIAEQHIDPYLLAFFSVQPLP